MGSRESREGDQGGAPDMPKLLRGVWGGVFVICCFAAWSVACLLPSKWAPTYQAIAKHLSDHASPWSAMCQRMHMPTYQAPVYQAILSQVYTRCATGLVFAYLLRWLFVGLLIACLCAYILAPTIQAPARLPVAWSAYCLIIAWSSYCFIYWTSHYRTRRLSGLLIARRQTLVCLSNRLLQIAYTARSQVRSYLSIGAENNALYAAAGALLRGCLLHKCYFARLLGKFQVCLLLSM